MASSLPTSWRSWFGKESIKAFSLVWLAAVRAGASCAGTFLLEDDDDVVLRPRPSLYVSWPFFCSDPALSNSSVLIYWYTWLFSWIWFSSAKLQERELSNHESNTWYPFWSSEAWSLYLLGNRSAISKVYQISDVPKFSTNSAKCSTIS